MTDEPMPESTPEAAPAPTPAPAPSDPNRTYQVLTRRYPRKDGTEKVVVEKYNKARRDLKKFIEIWEKRTGKKCTPRQIKKLRRQARQQETLQQALERSAQEQAQEHAVAAEDVGLNPHQQTPEAA